MLYTIITTTKARLDIQDAIDWENKRKPGLAKKFLSDLEEKLQSIARFPYVYNVRYENVRCVVTDIFPYLIHFIIEDTKQQLIILRVLHTSREPIW